MGGIADTVAQTLTAIRQRANRKGSAGKDDFIAIQIHELDRRNPYPAGEIIPDSKRLPPPFDFERLTRFMSYGFLMAPIQHKWFGFLSSTFPITKTAAMVPALKRVAFDQFLFAPVGMCMRQRDEPRGLLTRHRFGMLLHIYDGRRGRWKAGSYSQVPGCLCSSFEGQLHGVAWGPDPQLPCDSHSVSDCTYGSRITE